jgi:hypothetical protein
MEKKREKKSKQEFSFCQLVNNRDVSWTSWNDGKTLTMPQPQTKDKRTREQPMQIKTDKKAKQSSSQNYNNKNYKDI